MKKPRTGKKVWTGNQVHEDGQDTVKGRKRRMRKKMRKILKWRDEGRKGRNMGETKEKKGEKKRREVAEKG